MEIECLFLSRFLTAIRLFLYFLIFFFQLPESLNSSYSVISSKAGNLFEKNAAPILHLSGLDVTVVKVRADRFCYYKK